MSTISLSRKNITARIILILVSIISAVALPQIFHALGVISGTGAALGTALLPMHIPVFLAGLTAGPVAGAVTGVLSPVVSYLIAGMPAPGMVPYMVAELMAYGLICGFLSKAKLNTFAKVLIAQAGGRLVRMGAMAAVLYIFADDFVKPGAIFSFITAGLIGTVIQWAVIPYLAQKTDGLKKYYE